MGCPTHLPIPLHCATLERQLLLSRAAMAARETVGHLAGLQAQAPLAPYVGLWTRLAGFRPQYLENLLTERCVVRAHLMRNTVHLLTAEDFVAFRPLLQPLMDRGLWRSGGQVTVVLAAAWLDGLEASPPDPARAREQLVLRYLAAYGPATVADIQAWSGLSRLREVTERLCAVQRGARLPFIRLSAADTNAIAAEGDRLLDFAGPEGIARDVRFAPVS